MMRQVGNGRLKRICCRILLPQRTQYIAPQKVEVWVGPFNVQCDIQELKSILHHLLRPATGQGGSSARNVLHETAARPGCILRSLHPLQYFYLVE
jgi:hypothetical protein